MLLKKGQMMISVDTNVLVRIFIDDKSTSQVEKARALAKKEKKIFIAQTVQTELVWVLKRAYKITKQQILRVLDEISSNAAFIIQNEQIFDTALSLYEKNNIDFSDCLIFAESFEAETKKIYTFDKQFAKLPHVSHL